VSRKLQCAGHQILTKAEIRNWKIEIRLEKTIPSDPVILSEAKNLRSTSDKTTAQILRFAQNDSNTLPLFTFEFRISRFDFRIS
jgi:hypothetical protein